MPYEAYGQQVANNIQTAYSDFLMGMREGRAMREQSLREKAFEQEQKKAELQFQAFEQEKELRNLQINQAKRLLDLERVTALGSSGAQSQFEKLQSAAVNEDYDSLRRASYMDVQLEGADPEALAKFNNAQREAFRIQKANALSASAGQKNRLQDINSLTEYSLTLAEDPVRRGYADEARALLQAGIPISQLGAEHAKALQDSAKYMAEKAINSNPTILAKKMDLTVEMAKMANDSTKLDLEKLDKNVDSLKAIYENDQKAVASAAQSGNKDLVASLKVNADASKANYLEAVLKRDQAQAGIFSAKESLGMMQSAIVPPEDNGGYTVTYTVKGMDKPITRKLTQSQFSEAQKLNALGELKIIDYNLNMSNGR